MGILAEKDLLQAKKRGPMGRVQTVEKASQNFSRTRKTKLKTFSAGAHPRVVSLARPGQFTFCTWQKIHIRLQVWNLYAFGVQIMRAADCKKLSKKPNGLFRQAQRGPMGRVFLISRFRRRRPLPPRRVRHGYPPHCPPRCCEVLRICRPRGRRCPQCTCAADRR